MTISQLIGYGTRDNRIKYCGPTCANLYEQSADIFAAHRQYRYAALHYAMAEEQSVGFKARERLILKAIEMQTMEERL